jgi:hypothetical protein
VPQQAIAIALGCSARRNNNSSNIIILYYKSKYKGHPRTGHEDPEME